MIFPTFLGYFTNYIIRAKTRQRLLFLAISGLMISSFALIVIQSTMGGLQNSLIGRSKEVSGHVVLSPSFTDQKEILAFNDWLKEKKVPQSIGEYEIEVLLKYGQYLSPVIAHGIDFSGELPEFLVDLESTDREIVLGRDLGMKMNIDTSDKVRIISPAHVDSFMGDIPRAVTLYVDDIVATDVPEIDLYHAWVNIRKVQNLIGRLDLNKIRLYGEYDYQSLKEQIKIKYGDKIRFTTWEQQNKTLVWALGLESTVMIFLFVAMTLLVSLCITSSLLIFFSKIRTDLASFWILGSSKASLERSASWFLQFVGAFSVLAGLLLGVLFLYVFDKYGVEIMPDVFVDRKIPVHITMKGVLLSFFVPYSIGLIFSYVSLSLFKKDTHYLDHVRSVGA